LYGGYVSTQGRHDADASSAHPGFSEHQLGLAADVEPASRKCEVASCFADTTEGKWVADNAYKYGFIIRYQKNRNNLTGYEYEPWHVRYVGKALAGQIQQSGQTMEQFFGLQAFADYPANPYQLAVGQ
jgi:D-alanyl-D-alanine carboxypeptidase